MSPTPAPRWVVIASIGSMNYLGALCRFRWQARLCRAGMRASGRWGAYDLVIERIR